MGETLSFIFVCILGIITTSIYQRGDKNINLSQEEEEEEEDHGPSWTSPVVHAMKTDSS